MGVGIMLKGHYILRILPFVVKGSFMHMHGHNYVQVCVIIYAEEFKKQNMYPLTQLRLQ